MPTRSVGLAAGTAGLAVVPLVVVLARLDIDPAVTAEAGRENLRALVPFWIAAAAAWAGLTGLALALRRTTPPSLRRSVAPSLPCRSVASSLLVLLVAAAARLVVVLTHAPGLSDDVHRYVFDGRNAVAGVNPYAVRPLDRIDAPEERWPGERALAARVNNPELHTIYLPVAQGLFALAAVASPADSTDAVTATVPVRLALSLCDLGAVVVLLLLLRRFGRSPWWAALYAWHPLAITEIAGSGHQESLGVLLLLLGALLARMLHESRRWVAGISHRAERSRRPRSRVPRTVCHQRGKPESCPPRRGDGISVDTSSLDGADTTRDRPLAAEPRATSGLATRWPRRTVLWATAMSAACLVKPVAAPVALLALRGRAARHWIIAAATAVVVVTALAAPLLLADGGAPLAHLRATATRFTLKWAHFGPVHEPLLATIEQVVPAWTNDGRERLARGLCLAALLAAFLWAWFRRPSLPAAARTVLLAMVVLSPAAHPWYLLWALAFVPLAPTATAWVASLAILLAHAAWAYRVNDAGAVVWGARPWAWFTCWGIVAVTALLEGVRQWTVDSGQGTVDSRDDDDRHAHRHA